MAGGGLFVILPSEGNDHGPAHAVCAGDLGGSPKSQEEYMRTHDALDNASVEPLTNMEQPVDVIELGRIGNIVTGVARRHDAPPFSTGDSTTQISVSRFLHSSLIGNFSTNGGAA